MPDIRVSFTGPAPAPVYELTNGRASDVGVGLDMSDRSPGWGLGAHAFIIGGIGHVQTDQMDGRRYFGEGGGGVTSGPFGVDISVKYTVNRFSMPVSAQHPHDPDQRARHAHLLMRCDVAGLARACQRRREARGLPALKPLLETLARSTQALRDADEDSATPRRPPETRDDDAARLACAKRRRSSSSGRSRRSS